jgi:hypothetical protein
VTHQPKGGMCGACKNQNKDCSKLPFKTMPKIETHGYAVIVRCLEFKRADE